MRDLNIFRKAGDTASFFILWTLGVLIAIFYSNTAVGLDPEKRGSQYMRNKWTLSNGFPGGRINSIAQTPDGYLWIATGSGLFRFDGFSFLSFGTSNQVVEPITQALNLITDLEGSLWVRDQDLNVLRFRNGSFEDVTSLIGMPRAPMAAIARAAGGGLLLSTDNQVIKFKGGKGELVADQTIPSGHLPQSIAETSDGKVWLATYEEGLFYRDKRGITSVEAVRDSKINRLLPAEDGKLWIGTDDGLVLWDGTQISTTITSNLPKHTQVLSLARDRDANLWIGTSDGLFRLNSSGLSFMRSVADQHSRMITAIFEDREGNLWVGDSEGIERFRDGLFTTYSMTEGLPSESNGPIFIDSDDCIWFAPSDGGLYQIRNNKVIQVAVSELHNDKIYSITGDESGLWIGRRQGGLTHLIKHDGAFVAKTYTSSEGLAQNSVSAVFRSRDGAIWAGTLSGGVSKLESGRITNFTTRDGLGSNAVASIEEGSDGAMWFATSGGLSGFSAKGSKTYTVRDGLSSDDVLSLCQGPSGVLWIGTSNGLSYLQSGQIHSAPERSPLLHEAVMGIVEDRRGSLWLSTSNHVLRLNRENLLNGQFKDGDLTQYGTADGLHATEGVRPDRSVISDHRGRIWFSVAKGISVVDPDRLSNNPVLPIPHIESISDDGKQTSLDGPLRIAASPQRIVISYLGLNLAEPNRVRYRYRLEDFDREWSEPTDSRHVVYTNLGPGSYKFRLIASNGDGIWSGTEINVPFEIEPALWQAWWFQIFCVLAMFLVAWLLYLLRMHQITHQLNLRFEERLSERMRIAQDLHDTLLQGVLSASMLLHVAEEQVSEDSIAKPQLRRIIELISHVTEEGRKTLKGLRYSVPENRGLEQALARIPEECAFNQETAYRVAVEGVARLLQPAVRAEVYRIGREAVVNAFRHSQATTVQVKIEYSMHHLQIVVRDNGCGIESDVLHLGREGHWGLLGMREHAQGIGARLTVQSRAGVGTEVDLVVPGRVAFQPHPSRPILDRLLRRSHDAEALVRAKEGRE